MQANVRSRILQLTRADAITRTELIQPLWNNYGTLSRVFLRGGFVCRQACGWNNVQAECRSSTAFDELPAGWCF